MDRNMFYTEIELLLLKLLLLLQVHFSLVIWWNISYGIWYLFMFFVEGVGNVGALCEYAVFTTTLDRFLRRICHDKNLRLRLPGKSYSSRRKYYACEMSCGNVSQW